MDYESRLKNLLLERGCAPNGKCTSTIGHSLWQIGMIGLGVTSLSYYYINKGDAEKSASQVAESDGGKHCGTPR